MLISNSKEFIFIHIYKTAGTSVSKLFVPYCRLIDRLAYDFKITSSLIGRFSVLMKWQDNGFKEFTGFSKHSKAIEVKNKLGDRYENYFKFIFVRNPFDLLVSMFHYIQQSPNHKDYIKVSNQNFKEFVKDYISQKPNLQIDFMTDPNTGEIIVDFVGRFENLNEDIEKLKDVLDIKNNLKLVHANSSNWRNKSDFRIFYDTELRLLVESYFKRDFDMLDYNFS